MSFRLNPNRPSIPVTQRTRCKLFPPSFSVVNGAGPGYLSELLTTYTPSCQFCSASDTRLYRIPSFKTKKTGKGLFHVKPLQLLDIPHYNCLTFHITTARHYTLQLLDITHPSLLSGVFYRHICSTTAACSCLGFVVVVVVVVLFVCLFVLNYYAYWLTVCCDCVLLRKVVSVCVSAGLTALAGRY